MTDDVATSDPPRKRSTFARVVTGGLTVIAVVSFLVFLASAVAVIPNQRKDMVLLKRAAKAGDAWFLVADNDALRLTRQRMAATTQGVTVDATQLDSYGVTTTGNSGTVIRAKSGTQQLAVTGNIRITFGSKPPAHGGLGVRWGEYGITPNLKSKLPGVGRSMPTGAGAAIVQIESVQFSASTQNLFISYWTMLLVSAALACLTGVPMFRRIRSGRRIARNLCATCGYDLRASPDRCPECGTPITLDRTASAATSHDRSTDTGDDAAKTSAGTAGTSSAPIA